MEHREFVVLVVGASSGIGNACATYLAKKGFKTYGSCRDAARYERKADEFFEPVQLDPADASSVAKAAECIIGKEGHVDSVVCCVDLCPEAKGGERSIDEARLWMEASYFGTLRIIDAFRAAMSGSAAASVALIYPLSARLGLPPFKSISATACSLEALSESADRADRETPAIYALEYAARKGDSGGQETALAVAKAVYSLLGGRIGPRKRIVAPLPLRLLAFGKRILPRGAFMMLARIYSMSSKVKSDHVDQ